MNKKKQAEHCPCGSGSDYPSCCGRYIEAGQWPASAEELMRSRYSAYALKKRDYLLATWHPDTAPAELDVYENEPVQWVRLKVLQVEAGKPEDDSGTVTFSATLKANGRAENMRECSEFVKRDGHWYYLKPV